MVRLIELFVVATLIGTLMLPSAQAIQSAATSVAADGSNPWAVFAVIVIVLGGTAAIGGIVLIAGRSGSRQNYPCQAVYYCGIHRMPMYYAQGWLWCQRGCRYPAR